MVEPPTRTSRVVQAVTGSVADTLPPAPDGPRSPTTSPPAPSAVTDRLVTPAGTWNGSNPTARKVTVSATAPDGVAAETRRTAFAPRTNPIAPTATVTRRFQTRCPVAIIRTPPVASIVRGLYQQALGGTGVLHRVARYAIGYDAVPPNAGVPAKAAATSKTARSTS